MKKLFIAFAFMLMSSLSYANDNSQKLIEENIYTLNEISEITLNGEQVLITFNQSSEAVVSLKCWAFKQWVKKKLREVSDNDELIDETADALKEICEKLNDWGLI